MRIAILAALQWECRPVLRQLRQVERFRLAGAQGWRAHSGAHEIWLLKTGVGVERAQGRTTELLHAARFDACVSTGCAGALAEELVPGALVSATEILTSADRHTVDAALRQQVEQFARATPIASGAFLCSPRVLASRRDKNAARQSTGAIAVEMEGAGIAQAAAAAKVPFAAVRAVLDSLDHELPESGNFVNPDSGTVDWLAVGRGLATIPARLPAMIKLRHGMSAAERSLERFFQGYLSR